MQLFSLKKIGMFVVSAFLPGLAHAWLWNDWGATGYDLNWHPIVLGTGLFYPQFGNPQPATDLGFIMATEPTTPGTVTLDQVFTSAEKISFTWNYGNGTRDNLHDVYFGYMVNGVETPLMHTIATPGDLSGAATAYIGKGEDFAFYMFWPTGDTPNLYGQIGTDGVALKATITPVPEPVAALLLLCGLGFMAAVARRYQGRHAASVAGQVTYIP